MKGREAVVGTVLALGAAVAYGVNAIVAKEGMQRFGVVLPGLVVAIVAGLLAMTPLALRALPPVRPPARSVGFIMLAGLCAAGGIGSYFLALSQLPVSIVVPISSAYPLVTLLLARLFLHRSERITWRTALGVLCVVAGIVVIALNRAR